MRSLLLGGLFVALLYSHTPATAQVAYTTEDPLTARLVAYMKNPVYASKFAEYKTGSLGAIHAVVIVNGNTYRLNLFPETTRNKNGAVTSTKPTLDIAVPEEWELRDSGLSGRVTLGYVFTRGENWSKIKALLNTDSKANQEFWDLKRKNVLTDIIAKLDIS